MKNYTALLNIDHLKFGEQILQCLPSEYTWRECSNVFEKDGVKYWALTGVKDKVYSQHIVSSNNGLFTDAQYRGILDLPFEMEDCYYYRLNGEWHVMGENKSEEKQYGLWKISHCYATDLFSKWYYLGGKHSIDITNEGWASTAVYSPAIPEPTSNWVIIGGRKMTVKPHTENPGLAKWNGTKYVINDKPMFTEKDIPNCQNVDIGDDMFMVDDKYVMCITMLKNWSTQNPEKGYWCQGIAYSDNLESGWKIQDLVIKDKNGVVVFKHFFYSDGWKAIATRDYKSFFLAEIVVKNGGVTPPPNNGENMLNLKATTEADGRTLLSYNHPDGVHNIHFDRKDKNGNAQYMNTRDFLPKDGDEKGELRFENIWNATEFRAKPDPGKWEGWVSLDGGTVEPPNPNFNKAKVLASIGKIRTEMDILETEVNKA